MNIGLIINPKSGRNKAATLGSQCELMLKHHNHSIRILNTQTPNARDQEVFEHADRLIIIGGDGTIHHALPNLIKHQKPFIHLATGTSNLIAKELEMPASPEQCVQWIEQGGSAKIDVPTIDSVPFLIMCNFGMDASVIHRFQTARKHSGGFRNYFIPVIQESLNPNPARVQFEIQGSTTNTFKLDPGNLIIANMRSYALSIDPCYNADPADGVLDILASPCSNTFNWTLQILMHRFRVKSQRRTYLQTQEIQITGVDPGTKAPTVVQVDGELAITPQMPSGHLQHDCTIKIEIGKHTIPYITKAPI